MRDVTELNLRIRQGKNAWRADTTVNELKSWVCWGHSLLLISLMSLQDITTVSVSWEKTMTIMHTSTHKLLPYGLPSDIIIRGRRWIVVRWMTDTFHPNAEAALTYSLKHNFAHYLSCLAWYDVTSKQEISYGTMIKVITCSNYRLLFSAKSQCGTGSG